MNGPVQVMYSLKPLINFSEDIDLPTNMYKMKTIYSTFDKTKSETPQENKDTNTLLDNIEVRQSFILQQLKELQNQMEVLRNQLSQSQLPNKPSKQDCHKSNVSSSTRVINFKETGLINDVVVNADPKYPPYSLLGVHKLWSGILNLNLTSFVHSSITTVPAELLSQFSLQHDKTANTLPTLNITLVWKEIGPDCEFIISPLTHCSIRGEMNVLRFFHRHASNTGDAVEETIFDGFLDSCYSLNHVSQKEQKAILRKLNASLGKADWYGGDSLSLHDVAAWSSIRNIDNSDLAQKMLKWLERCNQEMGVSAA